MAAPTQSAIYCEGLDDNGQWLLSMAYVAIEKSGAIADLGQISPFVRRHLDKLVREGTLIKYRGYWNTLLPFTGMGPLKTIWATPEVAKVVGVLREEAA